MARTKYEVQHRSVWVIRDRKTQNFAKGKATELKLVPFSDARIFTTSPSITNFYTQLDEADKEWRDKYEFEAIQIDLDFDMNKYIKVR